LQFSGWNILVGLGALTVISFVGYLRSRDVTQEEIAVPPGLLSTRSERDRLKAEFDVARRAQQQMLPDAPPKIEGLEIAAVCQPSREVGGDLYDFILLPGGKLGIVVADVSGKGVPASLFMTLTKGLLDSVSEEQTDPGEILREVNRHLYEVCQRKVFVTLFLGVIDPVTKTMNYARAGHNPTVFHRPSEPATLLLKPAGMGLGLNNGKIFDKSLKVETLRLEPNDSLFFYSDGITEAMNEENEEYGEQRLMDIAAKTDGLTAEEMLNTVMNDVNAFLGKVPQQDDQTLVVVRIDGKKVG
jgi:sigma-B regulation protein RsbU (phosphoserine phosphatase)